MSMAARMRTAVRCMSSLHAERGKPFSRVSALPPEGVPAGEAMERLTRRMCDMVPGMSFLFLFPLRHIR